MNNVISRGRLLAGAAFGLGLALVPQQVQAQCVVSPAGTPVAGTVTCADTTTTDTTYLGVSPADDRNYNVDTSAVDFTGTVTAGSVVDGNGLAFTNTVGGANDLNVVNDGMIQVDAGNSPTMPGQGALRITGTGATDINYSGTGSITNLGVAGFADGLLMTTSGTGNITADVGGDVTAVGPSSWGINAFHGGTSGDVSVTTATGTAVQAGERGISAQVLNAGSTGNIDVVNNASIGSPAAALNTLDFGIVALNTGTGAVSVTNNGAIGSATDRAQGIGLEADITNAASTAALNVSGSGAIWSAGTGISVDNAGTGTTTVNYTGAIDATGGSGIDASSTTGALSVTAGAITTTAGDAIVTNSTTGSQVINANGAISANAGGISANSTSGAITANVNANITSGANGVTLSSSGAKVVNVAATRTVNSTGLNDITFNGGGTGTVNNSGTIGATTTGTAVATGTATVAINNNSGGVINGVVTLAGGADTFGNTGTFNTAGANDFGAGIDVLTNNAGGTVNVLAGASFLGLETLTNAGTVNAANGLLFDAGDTALNNTGTINLAGALDLGAGTDSFANTGTGILNLTGNSSLLGAETFTQSGRINLNTFVLTGPAIAFTNNGFIDTSGSAGLAGFTSFSNAGTLDLAAGTFTVPVAVFTNSGLILADEGATTITGQTSFANSGTLDLQDGVANDVLTINSSFAGSGGSNLMVDVNNLTSDRLVINGAASGSTAVHADYLGGFNLDGVLVVDAVTSTANAFVLGSVTGDSPLLDVSLVQAGADYFLVAAPTAAAFDPLAVPVLATTLWYQSADEIFAETVKPATTTGFSFWGDGYYHHDKFDNDTDAVVFDGAVVDADIYELDMKRYGIQMGADYGFGGGRVGLTGGYAWANADNDGDFSELGLDVKGWNIGVYGQFGGVTGFHGEFLAKHDRYDAEFDDGAFDGEKFDIRSTGIDGSLGYRFGLGGINLDAHAGISHVRTKVDDIEAYGFNYDIKKLTSTRGRAGVRAIFGAGGLAPYVDATVYREFDGDGEVELFDGFTSYDLDTEGRGTWVRLEAGLSGNDGPGPILAAWGDFGDRKGLGLRAGWRFGGRVAEALPPPPPVVSAPPPPPPPATQTCPDGSVVLATDMCPPPPPPPPPPPEPERG